MLHPTCALRSVCYKVLNLALRAVSDQLTAFRCGQKSLKRRYLLFAAAGLAACSACVSVPRQSLLPPSPSAPPQAQPFAPAEPPIVTNSHNFELDPPAGGIDLEEATHTPEVTAALRHAEDRFRAGEALARSGEIQKARAEFDEAIDILLESPIDAWDRHRIDQKCEELIEQITALEAENGIRAAEFVEDSPAIADLESVTTPGDLSVNLSLSLPPSELPLEMNELVLKWIRYFTTERGRRVLVSGLRRQGRYRHMIQRILDEEGLPQEVIYIAQAESLFKPSAASRKRAAGIWQFMVHRGREYGLRRSSEYDERLDPEKATRAAARHLRDLYEEYGDWYLAMVAYNAGPRRVARATRRTGRSDFWEFCKREAIPRETRNYVPMILAITIMAKKPKDFGLEDIIPDPPLEYSTIHVHTPTHLGFISDILARPLDEIRELNPAVLKDVVPAGRAVHVPVGQGSLVMAALEMVPPARRDSWRVHRVAPGQSLGQIAALYGTSEQSLRSANGDAGELAQTGDLVVVPVSYPGKKEAARNSRRSRSGAGTGRTRPGVNSAAASLRAGRTRTAALKP
jgi:membrane-bound lytic murein transglycosylase D